MKTYIALLRGINVGGHRKVPMAELRELLTKSGLDNVKTYIQSGNVIFQSQEKDIMVFLLTRSLKRRFRFKFIKYLALIGQVILIVGFGLALLLSLF